MFFLNLNILLHFFRPFMTILRHYVFVGLSIFRPKHTYQSLFLMHHKPLIKSSSQHFNVNRKVLIGRKRISKWSIKIKTIYFPFSPFWRLWTIPPLYDCPLVWKRGKGVLYSMCAIAVDDGRSIPLLFHRNKHYRIQLLCYCTTDDCSRADLS